MGAEVFEKLCGRKGGKFCLLIDKDFNSRRGTGEKDVRLLNFLLLRPLLLTVLRLGLRWN
jgi:hypothetical protein